MATYVVSGAASGIGAATTSLLRGQGHRVITVDLRDAEVVADLSSTAGRVAAVERVQGLTDTVHGVVPCAGIPGLTGVDPGQVVAVNYFGAVCLARGLRPQLAAAGGSVVLLASNSITCQPGWASDVAAAACVTTRPPPGQRRPRSTPYRSIPRPRRHWPGGLGGSA
jgi:NAD(P)-dependent dehydrogenase (short-subunit alcohol dehydrogenase family)